MTNDLDWSNLEGELRAQLLPDFLDVLVGREDDENGARYIILFPKRLLTNEEVLAVCRDIAPIIRAKIPERSEGWAAAIGVQRLSGDAMGIYRLGWIGHADEWKSYGQTNHADWLALFERLKTVLSAHGVEKPEGEEGDFFLDDEDNGLPRLRLAIHRIEFLTPQLVTEIQAVIKDGYADWCVDVRLFLLFSDRTPPEGIVIWVDRVVEQWNRARLKSRLGDRLKL
jgi:hypothetical protein